MKKRLHRKENDGNCVKDEIVSKRPVMEISCVTTSCSISAEAKDTSATSVTSLDVEVPSSTDKRSIKLKEQCGPLEDPEVGSCDQETFHKSDEATSPKEPKISCCYGSVVFFGLATSLFTLTLMVIYAGFWTNYGLQDDAVLMVIGGELQGVAQNTVSLHVLPKASQSCQKAPMYPLAVVGAVGMFMSKEVSVCGGMISEANGTSTTARCYKLSPDNTWTPIDSLKRSRAFAAGIYLPERGWWITGGISVGDVNFEADSPLDSTELITIVEESPDEELKFFIDEPVLPFEGGLSHHCLVRLDKYRVAVIGGTTDRLEHSSQVWIFDWRRRRWKQGADLKYGRHSHACALVLDAEFLVVAGGKTVNPDENDGLGSDLAEIMEVNSGIWHLMPLLPKRFFGASFAVINLLPTIIGGDTAQQDSLLQLHSTGEFKEAIIPHLRDQNQLQYAVTMVIQERYVCFG